MLNQNRNWNYRCYRNCNWNHPCYNYTSGEFRQGWQEKNVNVIGRNMSVLLTDRRSLWTVVRLAANKGFRLFYIYLQVVMCRHGDGCKKFCWGGNKKPRQEKEGEPAGEGGRKCQLVAAGINVFLCCLTLSFVFDSANTVPDSKQVFNMLRFHCWRRRLPYLWTGWSYSV